MTRDLFGNGRLFVSFGTHGGLLQVSYWANQLRGASMDITIADAGMKSRRCFFSQVRIWKGSIESRRDRISHTRSISALLTA